MIKKNLYKIKKMEESIQLGTKSTENLFVYPLIGFDRYLIYEKDKNRISICNYETGRVETEKELSWIYRNMSFNDFLTYSKKCFLSNINFN